VHLWGSPFDLLERSFSNYDRDVVVAKQCPDCSRNRCPVYAIPEYECEIGGPHLDHQNWKSVAIYYQQSNNDGGNIRRVTCYGARDLHGIPDMELLVSLVA
jgi:hypothetical protein